MKITQTYLDTEEERNLLQQAAEILKNYSGGLEEGELEEGIDTENIRHTRESCIKSGGEWVSNAGGGNCWKPKKSAKDFQQGNF